MRWFLLIVLAAGCRDEPPAPTRCECTPGNVSLTKGVDEAQPMDGPALLARLRRHRDLVRANTNPRGVKVFDDELKLAVLGFCDPCGSWISDRATLDDMFPLDRLDDATTAVCLGLVLRDGTTAWGTARPRACR